MITRTLTSLSIAAAVTLTSLCAVVTPAEAQPYFAPVAVAYHRPSYFRPFHPHYFGGFHRGYGWHHGVRR
jgi:hypothetical protein